jgi:mannose-6-phosphate isomerase
LSDPSSQIVSSQKADTVGYPLVVKPTFQYRIWGQKDLSFLYTSRPADPEQVGEVWLTADDNQIVNGALAGKNLGELCRESFNELVGAGSINLGSFPLLVKFLFTTDKLSVQVHPKDDYARRVENSYGKTEMWHVLKVEPGARLAIGFREDVANNKNISRDDLRKAVESGEIEEMLNWVAVSPGDTFFVPAGTVHAIGAGLVICEIQQNSDVTYRLFDYKRLDKDGKPRQLHLEKSLDVLELSTHGGLTQPVDFDANYGQRQCLAACPYFATERIVMEQAAEFRGLGRFELWILLDGDAQFLSGKESVDCKRGSVLIVPAGVSSFRIVPQSKCVWMRSYPPDMDRDVLGPLRGKGYTNTQLSRVCFP